MNKKIGIMAIALVLFTCLTSCMSTGEVGQYGLETEETIALNLTKDPYVGMLFVTHVNGESTGAYFSKSDWKYINPLYIKLNGRPIIFTILCPVVVGYSRGGPVIQYRTAELRLTKLADINAGDVLTLKWMYQTQTFAFMDATGNIVQQTIPAFN